MPPEVPPKDRPIFVPLARLPYEKFKAKTKTVEVRNRSSPVARQVLKDPGIGRPIVLALGYKVEGRLHGRLGTVWEVGQGLDQLPPDALAGADLSADSLDFFEWDGPLVAFEVIQ